MTGKQAALKLVLITAIIVVFASVYTQAFQDPVPVNSIMSAKPAPVLDGTFIQYHLVKGWNDAKWQQELSRLKEAGMHYIVLVSAADRWNGGQLYTVYPTKLPWAKMSDGYGDVVDACLKNSEKAGFKVFVGLSFDNEWWKKSARDPEWLYARMDEENAVAAELYDNYHSKYPEAFYGWYWPWEVDNLNFKFRNDQVTLANAINRTLDFMDNTGTRLPMLLSPFMNKYYGTAEGYGAMWKNVFAMTNFKKGDIFCPQDSVGAGGLDVNIMQKWFASLRKAVDTKPGLAMWSNAETFDKKNANSASLERLILQMENVQPYVEKIISFSYSHYYSPNVANPGFHEAYLYYVRNGVLKQNMVQAPSGLRKNQMGDGDILLSWNAPKSLSGIWEYLVYRDGKLIKHVQASRSGQGINEPETSFVDSSFGRGINRSYEVRASDFSGNLSAVVEDTN